MRKPLVWLGAILAAMLLLLQPVAGLAGPDDPLSKIVVEYENAYGPVYMMWSDRNQLRLAAALIEEAQKDGKITPEEGRVIEKFKTEFDPFRKFSPDFDKINPDLFNP